jgi:hypothetical protein
MSAPRAILAFDFSYGPLAAVLLLGEQIVAATGPAAPGTDRAEALVPALDALLRGAGWAAGLIWLCHWLHQRGLRRYSAYGG